MPKTLKIAFTFIQLLLVFAANSQSTGKTAQYTLSGTLQDAASGEYLIGAIVSGVEQAKGVSTNLYGFYSLTLPEGKQTVRFSFTRL